jgi:Tfp pilus assembly protein PilF
LAWHWNNIAIDRATDTSPSSALSAYEQALEMDPRNPHIYLNRGIFYAAQGDPVRARSDFERALRIDRRFHPAYYELGNLDFDSGRFTSAIRNYRMALRLAPDESDYQANLSHSLQQIRSHRSLARSASHRFRPCE